MPKVIRKRLLFHTAFTKDLSDRYRKANGEKEKQLIAEICAGGRIIRKYRLRKYAEILLGFSKRRWKHTHKDPLTFNRKKNTRTADELKNCVKLFFERDDVSRLTTGRKQTRTKLKSRKDSLWTQSKTYTESSCLNIQTGESHIHYFVTYVHFGW